MEVLSTCTRQPVTLPSSSVCCDTDKQPSYCALPLTNSVFWYTCTYGYTWGAANWVIVAETLPLDIRGKGMGLSTSMNWISNFTVAQITPIMITNIGYKVGLPLGS